MARVLTCTAAPTMLGLPQLIQNQRFGANIEIGNLSGAALTGRLLKPVQRAEELGVDYLLVAQRWWGTAQEIEGSTYDCMAMTALYAAQTSRIRLITAIHPGFFLPAPIAKWGASMDRLTAGRWAINVTSGWHEAEFGMYGADWIEHDERYARSHEFIQVLRGAWTHEVFSFDGRFYQVQDLRMEPRPFSAALEVFQGGQSAAAMDMAAQHSDWMFLNGGPPEKIGQIIESVRRCTARTGRQVRFVLFGIPVCRATDVEAEAEIAAMVAGLDPSMHARRRSRVSGAHGMWAPSEDKLTQLDSNEGFASRLIGTPDTILRRMQDFHHLGIDCFLLPLHDKLFNREVLPALQDL